MGAFRSRTILALSGNCFRNRCMLAPAAAGSAACSSRPFFSIGYACRLNDHMVQKLPDYAGDRMLETSYVSGNSSGTAFSILLRENHKQGWVNSVRHDLSIPWSIRPGMVTCFIELRRRSPMYLAQQRDIEPQMHT